MLRITQGKSGELLETRNQVQNSEALETENKLGREE